jgi:hypothetical protein
MVEREIGKTVEPLPLDGGAPAASVLFQTGAHAWSGRVPNSDGRAACPSPHVMAEATPDVPRRIQPTSLAVF